MLSNKEIKRLQPKQEVQSPVPDLPVIFSEDIQ